MRFTWADYGEPYFDIVESWLDETAVDGLGIDDGGWKAYYEYWLDDELTHLGENFWCKIILDEDKPVAVVALFMTDDGTLTVSEYAVAPSLHGKGYGSLALRELLENGQDIIGQPISNASAIVYPNNTASQRAFEKTGFKFDHVHPDGDAWIYTYRTDE